MDGNTTVTFSLIALVVGAALGVFGYMANVKSKAKQEGIAEGTLQSTMNNIDKKIDKMNDSNEAFQLEHRQEHKELNNRVLKVEEFVVRHEAVRKKTKSDIDE